MAARLGNFIYWTASAIAGLLAALALFAMFYHPLAPQPSWIAIIPIAFAAAVIWGLGRGARYVLSGR